MNVRIKVCGITSYDDAAMALDLGADALGFNFHPASPRFLDAEAARRIIRRLPPLAVTVGVFVSLADAGEVDRLARAAGVQVLQLHGDESAEYCLHLASWPVIKAVRVGAASDLEGLRDFPARAFLLDSKDERVYGGTGKIFDWSLARSASQNLCIILAGGLNPTNVAEAIRQVHPHGVDVCSGVESRPGEKDRAILSAFIDEVHNARRESHP